MWLFFFQFWVKKRQKRNPPSWPGGWSSSFKFSSACEERCRDEITIPLKARKPSTWQLLKSPVLTACIWGRAAAVAAVVVCWEEGILAGACDGVEDRAGCHNSLRRVPLRWQERTNTSTLRRLRLRLRVHFDLWFMMCTLLQLILHVQCALPAQNGCRVDWSERMADAAVRPSVKDHRATAFHMEKYKQRDFLIPLGEGWKSN